MHSKYAWIKGAVVNIFSAAILIYSLLEIFFVSDMISKKLWSWILFIGASLITAMYYFFVWRYYQPYLRTFFVLYSLGTNNKLHSLREQIFIVYRNGLHKSNLSKIGKAEFVYNVSRCYESNQDVKYYHVGYYIKLNILKNRKWFKNRNLYKILAIRDIRGDNVSNVVNVSLKNATESHNLNIIAKSVTLSELDHNRRFAGLDEISVCLPSNMLKKARNQNPLIFECSYTVNNNIRVKSGIGSDYTFVIIPRNYGKSLQEINIKLLIDDDECATYELQKVAKNGEEINFVKIDDFSLKEKKNGKNEYILNGGSFKPDMQAAYFIKINFYGKRNGK